MSVLSQIKEAKPKVHFSEYIVTGRLHADEPKPAEGSIEAGTAKPAEPAAK